MRKVYLKNGGVAFVDDEDYEKVRGYRWYSLASSSTTYAITNNKGCPLLMHRLIMDAPPGTVVDHRDRNGLNNCRHNLRLCTHQQNLWNRKKMKKKRGHPWSPYLGVSVLPNGRYAVFMRVDGRLAYLGTFAEERDAALMYDAVARRTRGEFAALNFPDEHYSEEELQRRRTTRDRKKSGKRSRSPYLGVAVLPNGRYRTQLRVDGRVVHFGCFTEERDAALMYDAVVRRLRGEFATLNFPDEHYSEEELQRRRTPRGRPKKVAATT